ncbi:hypothetical protein ELQ35_11270 [Peribacillus cavernae]|uniref:ABM domain-containing protein n=2 Tax=Peribacillus cavernae TaxID=1674310 RepID=A0A433HKX3_9BACI|nr:hypothetical protein ELQ35_11270 [Peribacillus cavernae]
MENQLRELGRNVLVPVNKDAGCVSVYFLEPNIENNNPLFGVVSVWNEKETMDAMTSSEKYGALLRDLRPLVNSVIDKLYLTE